LSTLIIIGEAYKLRSSSLCSLLQPPTTSSLVGPNIHLSSLFSNTFNICYSTGARDQVSHQHKTPGKIKDLYTLIFNFLDMRRKGTTDILNSFVSSLSFCVSVLLISMACYYPVWWPGNKNSPTVTHACRKRRLKWVATLHLGDINTETWSSGMGVERGANNPTL
jgi:hypothetical protein